MTGIWVSSWYMETDGDGRRQVGERVMSNFLPATMIMHCLLSWAVSTTLQQTSYASHGMTAASCSATPKSQVALAEFRQAPT